MSTTTDWFLSNNNKTFTGNNQWPVPVTSDNRFFIDICFWIHHRQGCVVYWYITFYPSLLVVVPLREHLFFSEMSRNGSSCGPDCFKDTPDDKWMARTIYLILRKIASHITNGIALQEFRVFDPLPKNHYKFFFLFAEFGIRICFTFCYKLNEKYHSLGNE